MKPPFERVVAEHGATVLRVCRAVLGGSHDADDAWSETFLAALGAYPALPAGANVEGWLVTIAHRKAIDVTRARSREPIAVEEVPERASRTGSAGGTDTGHTGDTGDALELWRAVGALPEKQRLAVAYHYLGGLPFAEVAALLGGSVEAARRASSDGVKALRLVYLPEMKGTNR